MTANYVLLEKVTVGASVSLISFNNIPQTGYTDLVVKVSARSNQSAVTDYLKIQPNGTNPSSLTLWGSGSGAGSYTQTVLIPAFAGNSATANTFANTEIYITNYTSSNYKSISVDTVAENNATGASSGFDASLWSNTSPITSLVFSPRDGTAFLQYSTFSLYGIAAVGTTPTVAPFAAGGDIIQTDGTYWYHAFLSSGTFTPAKNLSCDYLVVAGGGGAGSNVNTFNGGSGGGGAGGLRSTVTATGGGGSLESAISLASNTAYTVTIGSGGSGTSAGTPTTGGSGTDSSIIGGSISLTSIGGGGGGKSAASGTAGLTGGSAGGRGGDGSAGTATAGTANQGYAGGLSGAGSYGGGGGGGAGVVGSNASSNIGGAGGNGVAISTFASATGTGVSNYYAGGGGGGNYGSTGTVAGGSGGGGAGHGSNGDAGTANTGGGGGGGGSGTGNSPNMAGGGAGGSGLVIVRYLA